MDAYALYKILDGLSYNLDVADMEKDLEEQEHYADMIGLSQDLRKKVQDGEINIDLLDEDTKSKVEAYQKW